MKSMYNAIKYYILLKFEARVEPQDEFDFFPTKNEAIFDTHLANTQKA